jgi:hypothetical protein
MLRPDSAGHLYHRLRRLVLKYSPDLNPIELAFSKLKAHLRKAAEHTIPRLLRRIGRVVTDFSAQELFSPCGLCSNLTGIRSSVRNTLCGPPGKGWRVHPQRA